MDRLRRPGPGTPGGFTIIELMIVVVILGVLAAVSVAAYLKFINRSRTAEAQDKLALLYRSSTRYVLDVNEAVERASAGAPMGAQFPRSEALTPADTCCDTDDNKCDPSWDYWETPTWRALDFNISDPHRFRYTYESDGEGPGAVFSARASADLDCDGVLSTWERCGMIMESGTVVQGSRGLFMYLPLE